VTSLINDTLPISMLYVKSWNSSYNCSSRGILSRHRAGSIKEIDVPGCLGRHSKKPPEQAGNLAPRFTRWPTSRRPSRLAKTPTNDATPPRGPRGRTLLREARPHAGVALWVASYCIASALKRPSRVAYAFRT
jgi:hypothetical protein